MNHYFRSVKEQKIVFGIRQKFQVQLTKTCFGKPVFLSGITLLAELVMTGIAVAIVLYHIVSYNEVYRIIRTEQSLRLINMFQL